MPLPETPVIAVIRPKPSIGLHQRDNQKLLNSLLGLRDLGNTLIVVEHDEDTMRAADYKVDIVSFMMLSAIIWSVFVKNEKSVKDFKSSMASSHISGKNLQYSDVRQRR